jgi:hypothetical protein
MIGLQGNLQRLLDRSPTVRVHLKRPAQTLKRTRAGWFMEAPSGCHGPYRSVVLNAPATSDTSSCADCPPLPTSLRC